MTFEFKELDYQQTPLGEISLRRRSEPKLQGKVVFEVKLGDEFLMSSLFPEAEIQLSKLGLSTLAGDDLDVVVGGLGLGYTAAAALQFSSVRSLLVIDVMQAVIDWHQRGLVPLGEQLTSDPRCQIQQADFFAMIADGSDGFRQSGSIRPAHAILLDIDHSPAHWLNPENSTFYTSQGLNHLVNKLHPGGLFGLWSNDPPDDQFMNLLDSVFESAKSHIVTFANPYSGGESQNTVYLAHKR